MKIHIHFLTNKLLSHKLSTIKCPDLISNRTPNHSQLDLNFFSSLFSYFKNISIKHITHFSNKIVLGINKSKNLTISTKNSLMRFFSFIFCLKILRIRSTIKSSQSSSINNSPSLTQNLKLYLLINRSNQLKSFLHKIINRSFYLHWYLLILFNKMSKCTFLQTFK